MGLVGNIAEVVHLRRHLIREETIKFYSEALVTCGQATLEVAYNACGTLSHIMSDQNSQWPEALEPQKILIAKKMIDAVKEWDETAERNINYRSLSPIINLLKCYHCPEAQTWAAWALASLTNSDATRKYRQLTLEEGGFEALKALVERPQTSEFVKEKAQRVINRVEEYLKEEAAS